MAHATGRDWDITPPDNSKSEYGFQKTVTHDVGDTKILSDPEHQDESLHRGLKARQISMIAIGGAVGMLGPDGYPGLYIRTNILKVPV
jgi:amino acid permease